MKIKSKVVESTQRVGTCVCGEWDIYISSDKPDDTDHCIECGRTYKISGDEFEFIGLTCYRCNQIVGSVYPSRFHDIKVRGSLLCRDCFDEHQQEILEHIKELKEEITAFTKTLALNKKQLKNDGIKIYIPKSK